MQESAPVADEEGKGKELLDSNDSVYLLIQDEQDRILLVQRSETTYSLPAGHIRHGEKPLAAAIREGEEELGIRIASEQLLQVNKLRLRHSSGKKSRRYFFKVNSWEGRIRNMEPLEHPSIGWHPNDETLLLKLPEHIGASFQDIEKGITETSFSYKTKKIVSQ